ncbi:type IV pili methyl-accepting chemotaxis transducer N-terminal domain-containing protein [Uliginosibacterium sp. 31-12]|uniref:type IV pili methyl-accepting chemotaxis transducer N-terminal domain-containing protein n=1 Tax=Uliginosibacterium sp. 31-12 TaxID=3062781 RepID=UPI0026E1FFB2|nr:type IV pili methyl-accepting chemotaxis transducer N-terminal domain-containing protein [Uliginosibacterium sp. 31-12]MDO6385738.1 type IV pili methyl-accepting chemotaxis transducer N-terminal domain-containing protein [Uliginosibacterium sp. 31-12]
MNSSLNPTRRRVLFALGALPLAARALAAPQKPAEIGMLEAINQAGRQRMLSQRMAKLYAQQLRGVREADARGLLADSMALFDKQLQTLREFAARKNAPELIQTYEQLATRWLDYRRVVGTPASNDGLKTVAALNEQVLALANQGTLQLEALHGGSLGKLVNIAGRQRMLSQRMSKFYFFSVTGVNTPEVSKGLDAARKEFVAAMQTLKMAPENTKDTESWIKLAETQWMFFDDALRGNAKQHEQAYLENNVAVSSENILQVMDKLTGLYATLS